MIYAQNTPQKPVIAIGIEVASPDLMHQWMLEGHLPTFTALAEKGCFAPLRSNTEISSGSIWPAFSTGTTPQQNNQFFTHMQLQSGTYKIIKKYANDIPVAFFWRYLEAGGKKTCVIDVAQTWPQPDLKGTLVAGWGSEYPGWKRSSNPPELIRELVQTYQTHPLCDVYRLSIRPETKREYEDLVYNLHLGLDRKIGLTEDVFARDQWDFFLSMFPETHWAMHLLYQTLDKSHPDYQPGMIPEAQNIFVELLRKIDSCLARLIQRRPEANVVVFSGSGMGPNYSGIHLLEDVLDHMPAASGEASPRKATQKGVSLLPARRWKGNKVRGVENLLSVTVLERLKKCVPKQIWDTTARRILFAGNRWKEVRAFSLPNDYSGAIRINLKGREPAGVVESGDQYDALCRELTHELYQLINVDTGKPAVSEVISLARLYGSTSLGDLPDLIVKWANDAPINAVASATIGRVEKQSGERRPGAHRDYGFVIASGDRIAPGAALEGAELLDLVPTFFSLLGVPIPSHFDGHVLPCVYSGAHR